MSGEKEILTLTDYIKMKLEVLDELCIKLTARQLDHLWACESEFYVDAFCYDLIMGTSSVK